MNTHGHTDIKGSINKFYSILRTDRKEISAIYMFAILAGLIQLSLPLGIQTIINFVMAGSISTSIIVLIVLAVLGTFLNGLLQVRQLEIIEKIKQKIFLRYSFEISNILPKINVEKLDHQHLPEMVNRFFDTISLKKGIEKILLDIPAAVIQILFGLLLLAFYHPIFIAFGILLILIVALILRFTSVRGFDLAMEASSYKYKVASWIQESARVVKTFKYARNSQLHISKIDQEVSGFLDARTNYFKILLIQFWSLISFKVVITAAMLILGSVLLVNQQINVGQFIASDIVIIAIINSVEKLIISLDTIYDTLVSIEKLGILTEAEKESSGTHILHSNKQGLNINFNNVSFGYPDGKEVLKGIDLDISAGEIVQICGQSGSGKSTLLRLLTGSFTQFKGSIMIDGMPIRNYDIQNLREHTGILLSSQDIFHGTILENITVGNRSIKLEEVISLIHQTGFDQFLQNQDKGLDTILDPFGKRLPGHVKQQILLMRALLGEHRMILLEEPFNYLEEQKRSAFKSILESFKDTTIIIASNDEKSFEFSDKIYLLQDGKISRVEKKVI